MQNKKMEKMEKWRVLTWMETIKGKGIEKKKGACEGSWNFKS
jgi:hypothetical protein